MGLIYAADPQTPNYENPLEMFQSSQQTLTTEGHQCECTDNVSKENYVCKIFAVLIILYVNSQLNGFHELMVFTIISLRK